jgi:hypothetical protein
MPRQTSQRIVTVRFWKHVGPECACYKQSNAQSPLSSEISVAAAARRHDANHLFAKLLLQRRAPRYKLESHPVIDHGEPAGRQGDALAVDAGDVLPLGGRTMGEPSVGCEL